MHLTARLPRETGREYALRTLKDNIIRLELVPGSMVSENELAAEMGLSRTPVREALMELAKVNIVEIYPQKGSAVALIDYSLVEESQFMRNVLECAVVEQCCAMATDLDIHRLGEGVKLQDFYVTSPGTESVLLELDNQFHRTLFDIAQKPQVYQLMRTIAIHFDRVRSITLPAVTAENVVRDHGAIVDAITQRNAPAARKHMEQHLGRYRIVEQSVREKYPEYFK